MRLTPRQITAFLEFSNVEKAVQLDIDTHAAQGDEQSRTKLFNNLMKILNGRSVQNRR